MAVETVPIRKIEKQTKDLYEATVIVSKRARQIIADRMAEKEISEEVEEELGLLEEEPQVEEDYVEEEKPTTLALQEFLTGELEWGYSSDEEDEEDSDVSAKKV